MCVSCMKIEYKTVEERTENATMDRREDDKDVN
jgi:hypothetical protein